MQKYERLSRRVRLGQSKLKLTFLFLFQKMSLVTLKSKHPLAVKYDERSMIFYDMLVSSYFVVYMVTVSKTKNIFMC